MKGLPVASAGPFLMVLTQPDHTESGRRLPVTAYGS